MKHRLTLFTVLTLLLFALILPTLAQDSTAEPTPPATLDTAPVALLTQEAAPVSVEMENGSGNLTINQNTGSDAGSTTAPTTPPDTSGSVPTPVVIVAAVVVGLVFLGLLYNQQVIIKLVAPLVPPESAQGLVDAIMPALTSMVLNTVGAAIPGDIDEKLFIEAARQRGLIVVRGDDGLYHTTRSLAGDLANLAKIESAAARTGKAAGTSPGPDLPMPGATTVYPDAG